MSQTAYVHHAGLLDDVVGIILLVDGDGDAVGGVGDLRNGIDDQAVVLAAVAGCDHVQAVADVEQRVQIVLVRRLVLPGEVVLAQLVWPMDSI